MINNNAINDQLTRGTIVFVKNDSDSGNVMSGNHPAVIIQNDVGNRFSPTVIVCYLTSQLKRLDLKTHVLLQHYDNMRVSVVQAEQIVTINKSDILSVVTKLRPEDITRVDNAVRISIGLEVG
ncbi:MAG: type II toxin-antitoxin system PemK/MazF family toxin [Eubacteriales bacterium]|nr:type II toxin-antitoxin system PemK/MazF family toxin [Eubacteriales bacterium]